MNSKITAYQIGWIGIRSSRMGKSSNLLKKMGFWKQDSAALNNRNAWNWVMPCGKKQLSDFEFKPLADAGLVGIAIRFTDAQWKHNSGVTDHQWQNRITIGA